jgi:hypothetical protein
MAMQINHFCRFIFIYPLLSIKIRIRINIKIHWFKSQGLFLDRNKALMEWRKTGMDSGKTLPESEQTGMESM